jgi:DNA-binding NarL/FixJ family response regulator
MVEARPPAVLVISGDRLFAEAVRVYLSRIGWRVHEVVADGLAALAVFDRLAPDAVLITDNISRLSASQLATCVRRRQAGVTVVVLGEVKAPAAVVLPRSADAKTVLDALATPSGPAPEGESRSEGMALLGTLTRQERRVLLLSVEGLEAGEIAARLGVSAHTVRTYLQRLYTKLGCHNRAEIIGFAARVGLVARPTGNAVHDPPAQRFRPASRSPR